MEIRVLQYFMAVARHENITKAAEELHLTQPTLSRQLSDLEDELGVQLLVRGKRKTQATEAGLIFKARAQEILRLTEKTKEPLIVSEQAMKHHELDYYFGSAAEKIEVAGTYNLLYNTIFFIEAGMGSALCFKGMADTVGSSRGLVFRPLDPVIYSANYVVWRRDQVFSRAGRLVVAALEEAFSHHA